MMLGGIISAEMEFMWLIYLCDSLDSWRLSVTMVTADQRTARRARLCDGDLLPSALLRDRSSTIDGASLHKGCAWTLLPYSCPQNRMGVAVSTFSDLV